MRWPGGSVGDAARSSPSRRFKPRFVPACLPHVAGPHRRGPWCRSTASHSPLGPQRWIGLQKRPEMGSPPGAVRSRPRNTVRGTPWLWRTCGYPDFSMPRRCEASRSVGPSTMVCADLRKLVCAPDQMRPARPRHFARATETDFGLRRTRRRSKNTGDDARLAHPVPAAGTG